MISEAIDYLYLRMARIGRNGDASSRATFAAVLLALWVSVTAFTLCNVVAFWVFDYDLAELYRPWVDELVANPGLRPRAGGLALLITFFPVPLVWAMGVKKRCIARVGAPGGPKDYAISAVSFLVLYMAGALNFDRRLSIVALSIYLISFTIVVWASEHSRRSQKGSTSS